MEWNLSSARPIALDSGLQRLLDDGYPAEVQQQHLLLHSVPYATAERTVAEGTLVCKYVEDAGTIAPPTGPGDDHQVWWIGSFPCRADGTPLIDLVADVQPQNHALFEGCTAQHRFSNKPDIWSGSGFPDHYEKLTHYVTLIQSQARVIDPDADARTHRVLVSSEVESVFRYADTASVRAEIVATSARLKLKKLAIIGVGGTGAYILDQVAKTPVWQIHLFDGDTFRQHNAFRSPGAATMAELRQRPLKVDYYVARYDPMRIGIVPHAYYLDATNVGELADFDFVFVCVDKGPVRKTVCEYLAAAGIPFIDVGMDVVMNADTLELDGTCRVTTATQTKHDHVAGCIPTDEDSADALYRQNIQVADLNALNAQLAVIKWKQLFGFYADRFKSHQSVFTAAFQSLTRDEQQT
jgi:hypothetical protein